MLKRSAFIAGSTAAALTAARGEAAARMWFGGMRTNTVTFQSYINATTAEY